MGYGLGVTENIERLAQMVSVLAVVGCRTGGPAAATTDDPESAPVAAVRVRGCVTIDDAPAPTARVEAYTAGEGRWTVPLAPDGCFFVERRVGGLNALHVSAPERGRIAVPLVPIAGALELELPLPAAEREEPAKFRSDDLASRLAVLMGWYLHALRGRPSRENLRAVAQRHDAEEDPHVRATYGLVYLVLARTPGAPAEAIEPLRVRDAARALSPTHVAWSVEMEAIVLAVKAGDVSSDYLRRVFDEHPDPHVFGAAAFVLASEAHGAGDREGVRAVLTSLRRRGADTPLGKLALEFDLDGRMAEGKSLPPFRLRALGGGAAIDSEALRGKVFVLHFWATWCRPCVEKLPALADLYARHAAEGLEIVSLSIDDDPATVIAFRRERVPMPWTHAWEEPTTVEQLRAMYKVAGSTKTIIVGRDGVVVAEHLDPSEREFEARVVDALARR